MNITRQTTPEAALKELTDRLSRFRIESDLTQAQLAERAGVSKRTVERIESGCDLQITTLVRLLRVLGLTDRMEQLIPAQRVLPMEMLGKQSEKPKRVRRKKNIPTKKTWTWGDEQ